MIPFYIYYSMFGFQRIGDLCWQAGDQQARGFLVGGTSGRTTLNGEGLHDVAFQSAFAMITVALICGAIAERVKYSTCQKRPPPVRAAVL